MIIEVDFTGRAIDPAAVAEAARGVFPDATFRPGEQFATRIASMERLGIASVVIESARRLASRVAPCFTWDLPRSPAGGRTLCYARRDRFCCIAADDIEASLRLRLLMFARTLGTPEVTE